QYEPATSNIKELLPTRRKGNTQADTVYALDPDNVDGIESRQRCRTTRWIETEETTTSAASSVSIRPKVGPCSGSAEPEPPRAHPLGEKRKLINGVSTDSVGGVNPVPPPTTGYEGEPYLSDLMANQVRQDNVADCEARLVANNPNKFSPSSSDWDS